MGGTMNPEPAKSLTGIHLMAKPIGPLCNLDCGYCFYLEFTWQGGEPTLVGVEFFERAVALQRRHAQGKVIRNTLQTNGHENIRRN